MKRALPGAVVLLLVLAGGTLLLAAAGAALISKSMWGYWVVRPRPDSLALNARQVLSVTMVGLKDVGGTLEFVPTETYTGPGWYEREKAQYPQEFDYYLLRRRVLHELEAREVIKDVPPSLDQARLDGLLTAVRQQGKLVPNDGGYDHLDPRRAQGTVLELIGPSGEPLTLVSWSGGEVSNDHLPYYEHLFAGRPGEQLTLVSRRQFYFDVAGIEGFEFPRIFLAFSIAGLVLVLPVAVVWLMVRRFSGASAIKRGLCPACRYDLRGALSQGCPECGWGRCGRAEESRDLRRYSVRGAVVRALARPPGWVSISAACLASAFVVIGMSSPGRTVSLVWWGTRIGVVVLVITGVKVLGFLISRRRQSWPRAVARFGAILLLAAITLIAHRSDMALRARFALSRRAFDDAAATRATRPGAGKGEQLGLYWAHHVTLTDLAVAVGVSGDNEFYANGFITFPDGLPAAPTAWGKSIDCTPIGGAWYVWRYLDSDRARQRGW